VILGITRDCEALSNVPESMMKLSLHCKVGCSWIHMTSTLLAMSPYHWRYSTRHSRGVRYQIRGAVGVHFPPYSELLGL
jgi:hypothetical protein